MYILYCPNAVLVGKLRW